MKLQQLSATKPSGVPEPTHSGVPRKIKKVEGANTKSTIGIGDLTIENPEVNRLVDAAVRCDELSASIEKFQAPLITTSIELSSRKGLCFSARFLEIDAFQPVITHIQTTSVSNAITSNQEGLLLIELNPITIRPQTYAYAIISKYGPVLLLQEIYMEDRSDRQELVNFFKTNAELMTGLILAIPDDLDAVTKTPIANGLVGYKNVGIVETLLCEHLERKEYRNQM